ncbi:alpha/beta hydrolase [Nonomuraea sp. GTA35]|uniref:alpha/beta hydrolase n=1 Tax=Nonomuraea sp. GTA35 TaxID=1676746 RepID=UPI0035C0BE94
MPPFNSVGTRCAGDLYLPETSDPVPGLVLGHSGVMVKEALAFFAPHFVKAGFAVLAIDYRTVGSSEGEPRGLDYPQRQVEDFRSAVSYLQADAAQLPLATGSIAAVALVDALLFPAEITRVMAPAAC